MPIGSQALCERRSGRTTRLRIEQQSLDVMHASSSLRLERDEPQCQPPAVLAAQPRHKKSGLLQPVRAAQVRATPSADPTRCEVRGMTSVANCTTRNVCSKSEVCFPIPNSCPPNADLAAPCTLTAAIEPMAPALLLHGCRPAHHVSGLAA